MTTFVEEFNKVQKEVHQCAANNGFWDEGKVLVAVDGCMGPQDAEVKTKPFNFGEKLALIHSELSEALEKHRKGEGNAPDEHCPDFGGVAIEFADVVIRLMDLSEYMCIDLAAAVQAKAAYNLSRPYKHGKKY